METGVAGVRVGHWTGVGSGVTVVLAEPGSVGSGEVRGGAPATREVALLDPGRLVDRVDAVVLCGGSAFGLAAADGVVRFLAERGIGFPTVAGPVPIVVAAAIYDLPAAPPGAAEGLAAAREAAKPGQARWGRLGAGRGATVGKWRGREHRCASGVGWASGPVGEARIGVMAVVNALGDVIGVDGGVLAGSAAPSEAPFFPVPQTLESTTLLVVVTDAALTKGECLLIAQSAHDGLARAVRPAHTRYDGDVAFALSTGRATACLDRLALAAGDVSASAIRAAVTGGGGMPAAPPH